jgi:hypothetical protein
VPKSRVRSKTPYTPPPTRAARNRVSSWWVAPTMLAMFGIGIVWLVLFYVTGGALPIKALGNGNLFVGFGFIIVGFLTATQWR